MDVYISGKMLSNDGSKPFCVSLSGQEVKDLRLYGALEKMHTNAAGDFSLKMSMVKASLGGIEIPDDYPLAVSKYEKACFLSDDTPDDTRLIYSVVLAGPEFHKEIYRNS